MRLVEFEQATESLATLDRGALRSALLVHFWKEEPVAFALMVPLVVIVSAVLGQHP
jgi:hypothetical protein